MVEAVFAFFGFCAACMTVTAVVGMRFAERRLQLEDESFRCGALQRWHPIVKGKPDKDRIFSVTRCTLEDGHRGPHHTIRPSTQQDHYWHDEPAAKPS